ncbi:MAG: DUF6691 family protein [Pseudomonadota bacterium]
MSAVYALTAGIVFGIGLIAAGMTDPTKIKAFLDLAGAWDPSLALVMAGAIGVGVFAFAAARRRTHAWSGERMELPSGNRIDWRLLLGGVLFGAGWGLGGFCPGPALVAASSGAASGLIFVAAMLVGMVAYDKLLAPGGRPTPPHAGARSS